MFLRFFTLALYLISALPAYAGQSEARDIARQNNCPPKKIEVYQNSLGSVGKTIYQVTCNLPKITDKNATAGPDGLLIACDGSMCSLLRSVSATKQ